jgi:radical SAM protein with 4Fe4S-binding SPASM domain
MHLIKEGLLDKTGHISFELSNICNRACRSPRCPLAFYGKVGGEGKIIMPSRIFLDTIDDISDYKGNYGGFICFSIYNEPSIDPRLLSFIRYAKEMLPCCRPFLITNGTYINQRMIEELHLNGLRTLWVSCYTQETYDEFKSYSYPDNMDVHILRYTELQIISDTYTRDYVDSKKPCHAPLNQIAIRCNGDVHLCCRDYETRHKFGNLNDETLLEILDRGEMHALYEELSQGKRKLDICRRCNTAF